jgi:hypothetical protein
MSATEEPKGADTVDAEFTIEETKSVGNVDANRAAWLAIRPDQIEGQDDLRALTALYLGAGRGTGWGKDLKPAQARVLAVAAQTSGLSPLMGEIVMLGGSPYVTEPGIIRTANQHPQFDGYDLEPLTVEERTAWGVQDADEFAFKCTVYRKDRSRPVIGVGRASRKNVAMGTIKDTWLPEMAQKRAVERALSRAFPTGLPLYDDQAMTPKITATVEGPTELGLATGASGAETDEAIDAALRELKWTAARTQIEAKMFMTKNDFLAHLKTELEKAKKPDGRGKPVAAVEKPAPKEAADEKPAQTVSPEPAGQEAAPTPNELQMSKGQRGALFAMLGELGKTEKPDQLAFFASHGVHVESRANVTEAEAKVLLDAAQAELHRRRNTSAEPCAGCWAQPNELHAEVCPEAKA